MTKMLPDGVPAYSWNTFPAERACRVLIEDDLRDALQSVRVTRPSLGDRQKILSLEAAIGIDLAFIGFPASSYEESKLCAELTKYVESQKLHITPVLMARALDSDLRLIMDIQQRASVRITADIYIPTSELRLRIEGWSLRDCLERVRQTALAAHRNGLNYRIAFEDSTRTSPEDLRRAVDTAIDAGAKCIVLNDTVGESVPSGAHRHVGFVREMIGPSIVLAWHGHNDRGLALANALAAIEAGAEVVSGTFLGVGERTGNIPLEQLLMVLHAAGNSRFALRRLVEMRDLMTSTLQVSVPPNLPIVGVDAFSTSTGTHAAAIVKARRLGPYSEDSVYSGVSALTLGRSQELLIGPNSGRSAVRAVLQSLQIPDDEELVEQLLRRCKNGDRCLATADEIRSAVTTIKEEVPDEAAAAQRSDQLRTI